MATSIYGFAQRASSGGASGATTAIRLYNQAVLQGAGEAGLVDNPDIFRQAREKFLEPLSDDLRVSIKMSESINEENRLRDRISDANLASSVIETDVNDALRDYQKSLYRSPEQLINATAFVFGKSVERLQDEIETRRSTGQSIGDLTTLLGKYEEKERVAVRLARDTLTGGIKNPNAYGWFVRTNPNDGSIVSIEIDTALASNSDSGFRRTDSYYAGVPVWTTTYQNEDGKEVARIGQNKYDYNDESKLLKRDIKASTGKGRNPLAGILPGGETGEEREKRVRDINLNNIAFGDVLAMPKGSVARDARGNYYYFGGDGVYKADSQDNLREFLRVSSGEALSNEQLSKRALPISSEEARGLGSFTNEDGTSRIIDETLLQGFTQPGGADVSQPTSMLPQMNQRVAGTFSSAPLPATEVGNFSQSTPAFEVPRKTPAVKQTAQVGRQNTGDFLASARDFIGGASQKIASLFRG